MAIVFVLFGVIIIASGVFMLIFGSTFIKVFGGFIIVMGIGSIVGGILMGNAETRNRRLAQQRRSAYPDQESNQHSRQRQRRRGKSSPRRATRRRR